MLPISPSKNPVSDTPPIVFIRHGETDWNKQGLIQGSIDTDLNEQGRKQAKDLAKALGAMRESYSGYEIYVSPQRRALQTLEPIAEALGLNHAAIKRESRLRELEFGVWEGRPFWELKASPVYPALPEERYYWRPERGESYEDGVSRVAQWRAGLTRPTLVISHGAVGRCLMGFTAGLGPRELVELKTPQGAWCSLDKGKINWIDAKAAPKLRPASADDMGEITRIRTSVRENHLSVAQLAERGITEETILAEMQTGKLGSWVAEIDGVVAAFAMADRTTGNIFALFTDPDMEYFGCGSLLLSQCEHWLRGQGLEFAILDTARSSRAVRFYTNKGWREYGGDDVEINMRKTL
jgi:broad specificity phosphatase PhoE